MFANDTRRFIRAVTIVIDVEYAFQFQLLLLWSLPENLCIKARDVIV